MLVFLVRLTSPSIRQLAEELAMDRTTVTANIKPLRKRGRLETTVDPTEARSRLLALTPKGKTFLEQALPLWQSAQDRLLKSLSTSNEDRLLTALREVAN